MPRYEDDFFEGKRPWSVIKDQVLGSYMSPYLAKVKQLKRPILLVDGFAGPGVFEDGSAGSPLIICQAAEKFARGNYRAFFFNNKPQFNAKLTSILDKRGLLGPATPILGDTTELLLMLPTLLQDQTVFLYLDPLGPTGCPYSLLEPFLTRRIDYSTEIVLMMHMPIAHRLAARKAVEAGREEESLIKTYHRTLTRIFGGDYWRSIMLASDLSTETRDLKLIEAYRQRLAKYLPYTGFCPVRDTEKDHIKYFIAFASRHPDAMLLMNDAMSGAV
jgi:three-Cys-motif partner protein